MLTAILSSIAAIGLAVGIAWRRREARLLRAEMAVRQQIEASLRESEERFRTLFSNVPIGLYRNTPGPSGRFLMANPAIASIFGFESVEALVQSPVAERYSDPLEWKNFVELLLARGRVEGLVLRLKRRDGTPIWAKLTATVVRNARDEVACFDGMIEDITERRAQDEQIRTLSYAVEQSPASIVITDARGNIQYVNPQFCAFTGYSLEEAYGQNPRILRSGQMPAGVYQQLWETISIGREWRGELHNRKKNGELYWEFASISPIKDPAGQITHFVAVKEDISGRKQAEAERELLIKSLRAALANAKTIEGLIPICAGCKKIREDNGGWRLIESYIMARSDARFTHGLCPACAREYFPDIEPAVSYESPLPDSPPANQ